MPGRIAATTGACPASTPKSPSTPGTSTWSTSPEKASFSGETRSKWKVAMEDPFCTGNKGGRHPEVAAFAALEGWRVAHPSRLAALAPQGDGAACRVLSRLGELLALFDGFIDVADHVE